MPAKEKEIMDVERRGRFYTPYTDFFIEWMADLIEILCRRQD
jgi:hypothetical protein